MAVNMAKSMEKTSPQMKLRHWRSTDLRREMNSSRVILGQRLPNYDYTTSVHSSVHG
jgi:hypothetical protein